MKGQWLADRIETGITRAGIPDIFFTIDSRMGWIELKSIKKLPSKETSLVESKISALQVHWLKTRWPNTWLLLRVDTPKSFYLFKGNHVRNKWTLEEFKRLYDQQWDQRINFTEFSQILQN